MALIRLHSVVNIMVIPEAITTHKRFATFVTLKRPFSTMNCLVIT